VNATGAGGLGAISVDISHPLALLILLAILLIVGFGAWKLVKLLWAIFS
jgi:hypothetical protein